MGVWRRAMHPVMPGRPGLGGTQKQLVTTAGVTAPSGADASRSTYPETAHAASVDGRPGLGAEIGDIVRWLINSDMRRAMCLSIPVPYAVRNTVLHSRNSDRDHPHVVGHDKVLDLVGAFVDLGDLSPGWGRPDDLPRGQR